MLTLAALAGCSSFSANPVEWWHGLQGGPLARTRPPPPNADARYPSLGSVPAKPAPPDAATRARLSSGLVADRVNAQYAAGLSPLRPAPANAGGGPPPPGRAVGDDQSSNATLQAANAPARIAPLGPPQPPLPDTVPNPPRPAPVGRVVAAPLPPLAPPVSPPAPTPEPAGEAGAAPAPAPVPSPPPEPSAPAPAPVASGTATNPASETAALLPGMPENPPPLAQIPGEALPTAVAATPPPATPAPPPPPAPAPQPGQPVAVAFSPGSAVLPPAAQVSLKQLAQRHGKAAIAVTGFGEADSAEPAAQSAALPLALARARAIAAELFADGVPPTAIRLDAQARGAGGAARILDN